MNRRSYLALKLRAIERAEKVRESYQRKMTNVPFSQQLVDKSAQRDQQLPVSPAPVGRTQ